VDPGHASQTARLGNRRAIHLIRGFGLARRYVPSTSG
jgi:hypothetical protein